MRLSIWLVVLGLAVLFAGAIPTRGDTPKATASAPWGEDFSFDYSAMLRALKPIMRFEVTEQNINAYLRSRPPELTIPEGFADPRITLRPGVIEVSARKRLLLVSTRVGIELIPQVVGGRLRLKPGRIRAGGIRLPISFHRGVAQTIENVVNAILAHNETQLLSVDVGHALLCVTAKVVPAAPPAETLQARRLSP